MPKAISIHTAIEAAYSEGGWGAVLVVGDIQLELAGYDDETSRQRLALLAVVKALRELDEPAILTVHTQDARLVDGFAQLRRWVKAEWVEKGKPVGEAGLWTEIYMHTGLSEFKWVLEDKHEPGLLTLRAKELAAMALNQRSPNRSAA